MRPFTVAATQVDVRATDVEYKHEIHRQLIAETTAAGCDLIVFPETSATGLNGRPELTFDGNSTHVGGAYLRAPDGSMLARSELSMDNGWIAVELDPEAYAKLTARLRIW